ncbi:MAG: putative porin, partial [Bacteroidota bacterium]
LRYQTPFVAPHYRPELGMWTLAMPTGEGNPVSTVSGNYPWVDLLAGIRVQKTLLYVRWEHANMGWPAQIGQWVPGYPLGDRRLRFGLDWKFLD